MSETYTLSEIALGIGEKMRTAQFWADNGVLQAIEDPNRKGKGSPRRFLEPEHKVANLAKKLAAMNCPIGEIRDVVSRIRNADPIASLSSNHDVLGGVLENLSAVSEGGNPGYTRGQMYSSLLDYMTTCVLAGADLDSVNLLITTYVEGAEIKSRILFLPAKWEIIWISTLGLKQIVGIKIIPLTGGELKFYGAISEKFVDFYRKALATGDKMLADLLRGVIERED